MALMTILKDPDAVLDYGFDFTSWLDIGETISSVTWVVPSGITKDSEVTGTVTVKVWLSGGTAGTTYSIAAKIVTTDSRTDERTMDIKVVDR